MAQKPVLRGEVGALARRVCGQTREEMWSSACGARRLGESARAVKPGMRVVVVVGQLFLLWCSPVGIVQCTALFRFVLEAVYGNFLGVTE